MQKSPTTDKDLNILIIDDKFRNLRQRAHDDYTQRKTRKDKKEKGIKVPKYKIGSTVILANESFREKSRYYYLVEIVDFFDETYDFKYYGIILKVTKNVYLNYVGRLTDFRESGPAFFGLRIVNIPPTSIKWIEK